MTPLSETPDDSWLGDEWRLFRVSRPSVLVIGTGPQIEPIIQAIVSYGDEPVATWPDAAAASMPAAAGTLLVRDVDSLDRRAQEQLNRWLDERSGTVRVIATSQAALYELVARGHFLEPLYYRLNVVCLDADAIALAAV